MVESVKLRGSTLLYGVERKGRMEIESRVRNLLYFSRSLGVINP